MLSGPLNRPESWTRRCADYASLLAESHGAADLVASTTKPLRLAPGRFDSPFDLMLELFHRCGPVEPFVAVGTTFNIRVFDGDRKEVEHRPNELSFGVLAALGAVYRFDDRWAIELEAGYAHIPIGEVVEHELTTGLGPVLAFCRSRFTLAPAA